MYRLILILLPFFTYSQTTVYDDFLDGDFSANPRWYGDSSRFVVNSQFQLSLADSIANYSTLATSSAIALKATWECELSLQFNPSGSNFARFYLMYNRAQADGQGQGYYLEIGGSSSDQISLYKATGNQSSLLIASTPGLLNKNNNHLAVRIARNAEHYWSLDLDTILDGSFFRVDSVQDSSYFQSQIMAWQCHYTRTRADKFFLHRVSAQGDIYRDTIAPQWDSLALDNQDLIIYFNEPLDSALSLHLQHFYLDSSYRPSAVTLDSVYPQNLRLSFARPFPENREMTLYFHKVYDQAGNVATGKIAFLNYKAELGHLIINEIMIDPSPTATLAPHALPESEYLELYNTSSYAINLRDWCLQINDDNYFFPSHTIAPQTYLILANSSHLDDFESYGSVLDIGLSTYSLLNDGARLRLISPTALTVDALEYSSDWYNNPLKNDGGWSIERLENSIYCRGPSQWQASTNSVGGTPGAENSANERSADISAPQMAFIAWQDDQWLVLNFSESISGTERPLVTDLQSDPALEIDSITWSLNRDRLQMHLARAPKYGRVYRLSLKDSLADCWGNFSLLQNLAFALPVDAQEGEILVSEILFAPKSGGADFIELYNNSERVFDLSHLWIARWDSDLGAYDKQVLSNESQLFFPRNYLALSEDIEFLRDNYFCSQANLRAIDLPTFPSDQGTFVLLNARLETIDRGNYKDDWHFQILEETSGVSLERVDFTHLPTSEKHWQSATEKERFATPGRANSQQAFKMETAEWEAIPPYFSPNGDGNSDQGQLYFKCEGGASVVTVDIYSAKGERIRSLAEYDFSAEQGYFLWDGFNSEGQLLGAGIYIAILEYYNDQGISSLLRTPIVLSR